MYRVFCESYRNYMDNYSDKSASGEYRIKLVEPLKLLTDIEMYREKMLLETELFKKLNDLMVYMEDNKDRYPKLKAFLWTLESREIKGHYYGVTATEELEEQTKIVNMFLSLLYWEAPIN